LRRALRVTPGPATCASSRIRCGGPPCSRAAARSRTRTSRSPARLGPAGKPAPPLTVPAPHRPPRTPPPSPGARGPPPTLPGPPIADVARVLPTVPLEGAGGNQVRAAQILGINRNTLRKKLPALGIPIPHGGGPR